MKRTRLIIFALLALCTCIFFASCSAVSEREIEENPQKVLSQTIENTTSSFFAPDRDVQNVVNKSSKKGAITVSFESDKLMGGSLTKIKDVFYFDNENKKYVNEASMTIEDEILSATVFTDKAGIALSSEAFIGNDATYLLNFATLIENLDDSEVAKLLGIEATEENIDMLNQIKTSYEKAFEQKSEENEALINEIYRAFDMMVSTENTDDGSFIVVSFDIDNDSIKEAYEIILNEAIVEIEDGEISKEDALESLEALLESIRITAETKLYINKKTNSLAKNTVELKIDEKIYDDYSTQFDGTLEFNYSKDEINVSLKCEEAEDISEVDLTIKNESTDKETKYTVIANVTMDDVSVEALNASYSYDKETGDILISADICTGIDEDENYSFELKGKLIITDKKAALKFTTLKMNKITIRFEALVSIEAVDEIPEIPSDAKDISTLTERDLEEILEDFKNTILGQALFSPLN